MPDRIPVWHLETPLVPDEFSQRLQSLCPGSEGKYLAALLWQRGIRDLEMLPGFLDPDQYQPASPFAFGAEMQRAVARLQQARDRQEKVAIWGDFDADGITATAVLWEGLGQFFPQETALSYLIPNRLTESHGLSRTGIEQLAGQGVSLIVTCDTGSTNQPEIEFAASLGMEVIVTDHHTLPPERPPVVAILNPRYLEPQHPLAHLSGVAVAYKLVEALYQTWPTVPQQPLEQLLDLVAIGLIADLVQLTGDCRYLAQRGIQCLQQHTRIQPPDQITRPGIARLLEFCRRSGDRPTDISFGLGPRINAVSRIQGDARFCVELLTSRDRQRCQELAEATEVANTRRKVLQKEVQRQVSQKLQQLDLSTTQVIVLVDSQWPVGILGLVAGQVAQEYGRPTILLRTDAPAGETTDPAALAWGSARSVDQIDLYQLVANQAHLLRRFGGHPFAAGLSLPLVNVPLFTEALNQQLRQQRLERPQQSAIRADLEVSVAALGQELFRELKLLEPCGLGNPAPKLLIRHCWFQKVWNRHLQDFRGQKLRYIKTEFELWDASTQQGFPGVWWEHYKDDLPQGSCDALVELDFNPYKKQYYVRLLAVRPWTPTVRTQIRAEWDPILDWRQQPAADRDATAVCLIDQCPGSWEELRLQLEQAWQQQKPVALAYPPPSIPEPYQIWTQLLGIGKYLARTGREATHPQLQDRLGIGGWPLHLGLQALQALGFRLEISASSLKVGACPPVLLGEGEAEAALQRFLAAVQEEQFRRQYFYQIPLSLIQALAQERHNQEVEQTLES